jgi:hypothetical protein
MALNMTEEAGRKQIVRSFGRLDTLVNNAGISGSATNDSARLQDVGAGDGGERHRRVPEHCGNAAEWRQIDQSRRRALLVRTCIQGINVIIILVFHSHGMAAASLISRRIQAADRIRTTNRKNKYYRPMCSSVRQRQLGSGFLQPRWHHSSVVKKVGATSYVAHVNIQIIAVRNLTSPKSWYARYDA